MSDRPDRRSDAQIEAMLRELDAESLELLEPPRSVWDGIESAVRGHVDADDRVVPLESRKRRKRLRAAAGIAAAALVLAGAAAYMISRDDPVDVVARAALNYDPALFDPLGAQAQADAELLAQDGHHRIRFVDADLPTLGADADLEAWLIQPDEQGGVADLVSLGLVNLSGPRIFTVPDGYDPELYSVVDISIEPRDGDPAHSGRSILRGMLRRA